MRPEMCRKYITYIDPIVLWSYLEGNFYADQKRSKKPVSLSLKPMYLIVSSVYSGKIKPSG